MTHNCPGDECARCARAIDRILNDGGTHQPRRGVSLRKPHPPLTHQRLADITADIQARNEGAAA